MSLFSMIRADTWDQDALRRKSLKLAKLLRNDFSDIAAELAAVFPNTRGLQERYVPLVSRVAHELSGLYARPVVRSFKSPTGDASGFADVYRRLRFDRFLHDVHRQLLVQHTIVVVALPGPRPGDVRLSAFAPWQIEWETGDLQFAHDLDSARKLTLSVPVEQKANLLVFGQLVLTPTEVYKVVGGVRQPVYGATTANPLGRIPAVVLRLEEPLAGRWASPVNEALLAMTIALCVSESDTELLVHTQAWGQKVIENAQVAQQVEELRVGPDKLLALVNQEPGSIGPKLSIVQGQPPLSILTRPMRPIIAAMAAGSLFSTRPGAVRSTSRWRIESRRARHWSSAVSGSNKFSARAMPRGVGTAKTMLTRRRRSVVSAAGSKIFFPLKRISPSTARPSKSVSRLRQRRKVVLPLPAGPITARISCSRTDRDTLFKRTVFPARTVRFRAAIFSFGGAATELIA